MCYRWLRVLMGVLLVLSLSGIGAIPTTPLKPHPMEIIVHRGANRLAPENTYAAAQRCIDLGVDYLEVDVQPSKDGVLYNLHDLWLNRTTNGKGLLLSMESRDVDQLDAGSWFGPEFAGERIPRFDQFLPWLKGKIKVNFDIRAADLQQLIELVRSNHMEQECFFNFMSLPLALRFHQLAPDLTIKMNVSTPEEAEQAAFKYHARIIEVPFSLLTPEITEACRRHRLKIIACAVDNSREEYQRIARSEADMVMLDCPDLFLEIQKEHGGATPASR